MTTISKELRDAIRAAAEKATPGPWLSRPYKNDDWGMVREGKSLWPVAIVRAGRLLGAEESNDCRVNGIDPFEDNAAHIANCDPQTILALLDALDAAEKAKPALWITPGNLNAVKEQDGQPTGVVVSMAADDDGTRIPLYTHPPATREGWVTVPVEPTEEMLAVGWATIPSDAWAEPATLTACWAAMLAAVPEAK